MRRRAASGDDRPRRGRLRRGRLRGPRFPRYTVRLRLTLLYGGVFLLCGAILLGIAYFLARQSTADGHYAVQVTGHGVAVKGPHGPVAFKAVRWLTPAGDGKVIVQETRATSRAAGGSASSQAAGLSAAAPDTLGAPPAAIKQAQAQARQLTALGAQQHDDELHQLLIDLGIALAVMAVASMGLGWLVAGRALRPLKTITKAARAISATNLHRRLSLAGPRDELRELGDTFDELLERLERSFAAQRQFVANASHELRTPLTLERAIIEVALADPAASAEDLRATCARVLTIGAQQEGMIEALLTLARGERGLERRTPFDLAAIARDVLCTRGPELTSRALRLEIALSGAVSTGDPQLVERLVANLIDNALRHNFPGGWVKVATGVRSGHPFVAVSNSGPVVLPSEPQRLLQPFSRGGADRTGDADGHGLGLSIVRAIADAHGARLRIEPQPEGGLSVEVSFALTGAGAAAALGASVQTDDPPRGDVTDSSRAVAAGDGGSSRTR